MPAWLVLKFDDSDNGVVITHTLKAGFSGTGRLLDPLLRLALGRDFELALGQHAREEFTRLAEILA